MTTTTAINIYNTDDFEKALDLLEQIEDRLKKDDEGLDIMGVAGFIGMDISTGPTGDHAHNWDGARVAIDEEGIIHVYEMWNGSNTGARTTILGKTNIDMIIAIINNYL